MSKQASRQTVVWLQTNWSGVEANLGEIETGNSKLETGKPHSASALARLAHASQILGRPVSSFNDLSQAEGDRLVLVYKQELGEEYKEPGYQGARKWSRKRPGNKTVDNLMPTKLAQIAAELWGGEWPAMLSARVRNRFLTPDTRRLTSSQARSLVEEMLQRIAVREIGKRHEPPIAREEIEAEKEQLRKRFFTTETQRRGA